MLPPLAQLAVPPAPCSVRYTTKHVPVLRPAPLCSPASYTHGSRRNPFDASPRARTQHLRSSAPRRNASHLSPSSPWHTPPAHTHVSHRDHRLLSRPPDSPAQYTRARHRTWRPGLPCGTPPVCIHSYYTCVSCSTATAIHASRQGIPPDCTYAARRASRQVSRVFPEGNPPGVRHGRRGSAHRSWGEGVLRRGPPADACTQRRWRKADAARSGTHCS